MPETSELARTFGQGRAAKRDGNSRSLTRIGKLSRTDPVCSHEVARGNLVEEAELIGIFVIGDRRERDSTPGNGIDGNVGSSPVILGRVVQMHTVAVRLDNNQERIGTLIAIGIVGPNRRDLGGSGRKDVVGVQRSRLPFATIGSHELAEFAGTVQIEEVGHEALFEVLF